MAKKVLVTGKWSRHICKFPNEFSYGKLKKISGICCYSKEKTMPITRFFGNVMGWVSITNFDFTIFFLPMGSFDGENSNRRLQRVDEANTMQSTDDVGDSEIEIRPLISGIFKETFVQYTLNIDEF